MNARNIFAASVTVVVFMLALALAFGCVSEAPPAS